MYDLEEVLKHHGVKGMRWGVVRNKVSNAGSAVKKGASKVKAAAKTRMKEEVKSVGREIGWSKELKNIHTLSNKQLQKKVDRVRLENEFKSLANSQKTRNALDRKNKSKDKKEYRNREKMSDKELRSKVDQLRLKDNLRKQISNATKDQRDNARKLFENVGDNPSSSLRTYSEIGKQLVDYSYGKY